MTARWEALRVALAAALEYPEDGLPRPALEAARAWAAWYKIATPSEVQVLLDELAAADAERCEIIALLDKHEIACGPLQGLTPEIEDPKQSGHWRLAKRVEIACMAATDEEDRHRAEAAEARAARLEAAEARAARLETALKPFATIRPSSIYAADGSEGEAYTIGLAEDWCPPQPDFTGADLARARAALSAQEASDDE